MPEELTPLDEGADDVGGVLETPVERMMQAAPANPSVLGDDAPEAFRGKSINDVYNEVQRLQTTLRINEEVMRRISAEAPKPQVVHVQPNQPATVAREQQGPTDEQLEEMMGSDDPKLRIAAVRLLNERNNAMLAGALEQRLAPLAHGSVSAAEQNARTKYALEFELFGNEIQQLMSRVPREAFTNPQAWDELIRQARGTDPVKYVTELQKRTPPKQTLDGLRAEAVADAGFVPPVRTVPNGAPGGPSKLDQLQRKVAEEWGLTESEFLQLSK